jgi:hypothetical protein
MELIGLYLVACVLLVAAGIAKALRPGDTARALLTVMPIPITFAPMRRAVRVGSVAEAVLGAVAIAAPGPIAASLVALSYGIFTGVVAYERRRGGAIASCGCFGTPDTPATMVHVVVNGGLAVAAAAVAWAGQRDSMLSILSRQPIHGLPLIVVSALCAYLAYLTLSVLAALRAARTLTDITFDRNR